MGQLLNWYFAKEKCTRLSHFSSVCSLSEYFKILSANGCLLAYFFLLCVQGKCPKEKGCSNQLSGKRIKAISNAKLDSNIKNELRENNGTMMKIIKVQKDIFRDQESSINDYQSIVDHQEELISQLEEANDDILTANRNLRVRVLELESLQKASNRKINSLEDSSLFFQINIIQLESVLKGSVKNTSSPFQNSSDK